MAPGVGGIIYPYLLQWLTETFGLNGTFLLLGGVSLNTIPLATLWGASNSQKKMKGNSNDEENTIERPAEKGDQQNFFHNICDTVKYKPFLFLFLGLGLLISTFNIFGILAMDIFATNGLSVESSIIAVTVSNAASVPSRLIPGFANRIKRCRTIMTPVLAAVLGAFGMILLILVPSFTGMLSYSFQRAFYKYV